MKMPHGFLALSPPYERMDHVALERPGPYDCHLYGKVFNAAGFYLRHSLHLGTALHLKNPHCVGFTDEFVHLRIICANVFKVD